jgi:cytidylate kinase
MQRYSNDKNRYKKLYNIDYDNEEKYNDIVIDTSKMNASETFNLILKLIKEGGYIK